MSFDAAREQMIQQQLRTWEVLDQDVLDVFERIPRERFVPAGYESLAYADIELPLGQGDHMLAPKVTGRILQALAIQPADQALEIGTGSGYLTAGLAARARSVRSLEIRADLAAQAAKNLAGIGVRNVTVEHRDAYANEALGSMGEASGHIHRTAGKPDRVVFFCCAGCSDDFKADPAKFLKKLDEAAANKAKK